MTSIESEDDSSHLAKRFGVTRLRSVQPKSCLIWRICEFSQCRDIAYLSLNSPKFHISENETHWSIIQLSSKGCRQGFEDCISLSLYSLEIQDLFITVEFSLINASGEKSKIQTFSSKHSEYHTVRNFLNWTELMKEKDQLLPRDELILSCVVMTAKEIETSLNLPDLQWPLQDNSIQSHQEDHLKRDLSAFFNEQRSADVVLRLDKAQIPAHKALLASRSPVFQSMLLQQDIQDELGLQSNLFNSYDISWTLLHGNPDVLIIRDEEADVFMELIRFMYTDEVSHRDLDFTLKLIVAADKYALKPLKARCVDYIRGRVSEDSVLDILRVADACMETELSRECMTLITEELSSVTFLRKWISQMCECPKVLNVIERLLRKR